MKPSVVWLKRLKPTPAGAFVVGLWILLGLMAVHIAGAHLLLVGKGGDRLLALLMLLAFGVPVLIAPRPTWEPGAYGVLLAFLALVIFGFLGSRTQLALARHGHWVETWLSDQPGGNAIKPAAKLVASASRAMASVLPVKQLDAMGLNDVPSWDELKKEARTFVEKSDGTASKPPADATESEQVSGTVKEVLARGNDPAFYKGLAQEPDSEELAEIVKRFRNLLAQERTKRGLPALEPREDLTKLAVSHATAMIEQGFFSTTDPQGRDPRARARAANLSNWEVFEVIAKVESAQDVPRELMDGLLADEGKSGLLLKEEGVSGVGVGIACKTFVCYGVVEMH